MSTKELDSLETALKQLPDKEYQQVTRVLYGNDGTYNFGLSEKCDKLVKKHRNLQVTTCGFRCGDEQLRERRLVRVGLFQQKLPLPLCNPIPPIRKVKIAMYTLATEAAKIAALGGVKIFCLQQGWYMPYAFCSGEKAPWSEYAENAREGPTTRVLQTLAEQHNMVIISTILERDEVLEDRIWNTAVVIDNHGNVLGKQRRNHVPRAENPSEPTYYCQGNTGHSVFETEFGKIAVNVCYDRHYPLSWLAYGLNGAEIVFNPCAGIDFNECLWGVEARNAAIANGYYVCTVNRVGTEIYEHDYEFEGEKIAHKDSGLFYGSSYVAAPNGARSQGLSRIRNGLLIAEFDLNLCRQAKDQHGFPISQRLEIYKDIISKASRRDYKPQIVKKGC